MTMLPDRADLKLAHRMGMDDVLEPLKELMEEYASRSRALNDSLADTPPLEETEAVRLALVHARATAFALVSDGLRELCLRIANEGAV